MAKRGSGFNRNRGQRSERSRILVVTEGEKTERQYLEGLVQYLRSTGTSVRGVRSKGIGRDPLRVLQAALSIQDKDVEKYDEVWVVVDVDEHTSLPEALRVATKKAVPMVVSNPSFEIWLLWHYEDCSGHQTQKRLEERLAGHGHQGKQMPSTFPYKQLKEAMRRAEGRAVEHSTHGPNPSSAMPHLVAALERQP